MLETFIADLRHAAAGDGKVTAIQKIMEAAVEDPAAIKAALPAFDDEEALIFEDNDISIWHCVYHPGNTIPPHDHRMSAIIGLYEGRERNDFYKADPAGGVRKSNEVFLEAGQTLSIGPSAIHAVACISETPCRGFHVYLGALSATDRSLFDVETARRLAFTEANYEALKRSA